MTPIGFEIECGKKFGLSCQFTPSHDDFPGADRLDDLELGEHGEGGVDLDSVAGDHDDHRNRGEIDGFPGEVFADLKSLGAVVRGALQLDHHQFLGNGIVAGVLEAVDDVDELADLLDDLVESGGIAGDADGHAREAAAAALGDDERVDIEGAA